ALHPANRGSSAAAPFGIVPVLSIRRFTIWRGARMRLLAADFSLDAARTEAVELHQPFSPVSFTHCAGKSASTVAIGHRPRGRLSFGDELDREPFTFGAETTERCSVRPSPSTF